MSVSGVFLAYIISLCILVIVTDNDTMIEYMPTYLNWMFDIDGGTVPPVEERERIIENTRTRESISMLEAHAGVLIYNPISTNDTYASS